MPKWIGNFATHSSSDCGANQLRAKKLNEVTAELSTQALTFSDVTATNANHADDGAATVNAAVNAASACLQFVSAYTTAALAASSAAAVANASASYSTRHHDNNYCMYVGYFRPLKVVILRTTYKKLTTS